MWRSVWRTDPSRVDTWNVGASPGVPTTYSVLPPPMSNTSAGPAERSRPDVAPRNVSRASSSPEITRTSKPWRRPTASVNSAPFSASRTALVATATRRFAPWRSAISR